MAAEKICKTVHQYNQSPISQEDMKKLQEIAADYSKVKNFVYARFGGVGSLSKIYPGYTVQKEMAKTGLREELGLPSVYFNLAILDAVGEIKSQWTRIKTELSAKINSNPGFTDDERHYLRFVLKISNAFEMVLNRSEVKMKPDVQARYDLLKAAADTQKLNNYLCRQTRKLLIRLHTDKEDGFGITERAYRYKDHGIYITIKEKRRRVFVRLTDNNQYSRQLYVKLYPDKRGLEIKAPIDVGVRVHEDYTNQVGLALGMYTMLVTDKGHVYGDKFGKLSSEISDWVWDQNSKYLQNIHTHPGRKKYTDRKNRLTEQLHSYINKELNCFIQEEKPRTVYIPKLPRPGRYGGDKKANHSVTMWQRGYIRNRLRQKCREHSIEYVEVFGKEISVRCASCGSLGRKDGGIFTCPSCGIKEDIKVNAARNARKRGMGETPKFWCEKN